MAGRKAPKNPDNFLKVNKHLKEGSTVDLGCGDVRLYDYRVDGDASVEPDLVHDLEEPLPIEDNSFANAVLVHTLEHLYNDLRTLQEAKRIAERVVAVVPLGWRNDEGHRREFRNAQEAVERYEPDEVDYSSMAGLFDLVMIFDAEG